MTDTAKGNVSQLEPTQQRRYSDTGKAKLIHGYGHYQYYIPAQDQIIAYLGGMKISGTTTPHSEDSQSDHAVATLEQFISPDLNAFLTDAIYEQYKKQSKKAWESEYFKVEEPVIEQETETTVDDISQWTTEQLANAIMQPEATTDMPRLREMILIAEDTSFTIEQSAQLASWLLGFAQRHRNSNDPQDEPAVWSAIRTGASMLHPRDADCLLPLLDPGHSIETSLVTVKMLGRIFEAQPPAKLDEHQDMANEVCRIVKSSLNPHVITASQIAAKAQLAIYALAAMASSETESIVKEVQELGVTWFTRRTFRKLRGLSNTWASHTTAVSEAPQQLLDKVLQMLE